MIKKLLFYFAFTGFICAVIVHILSLANIDVNETLPFVWLLHIGIFIVWIPTVFDLRNSPDLKDLQQKKTLGFSNPIQVLKIFFKGAPNWLPFIILLLGLYAFLNFFRSFLTETGTPDFENGQYVLKNHGQLIKVLTAQEYHYHKANLLRGFSGHWILFYSVATGVLYKYSGFAKPANSEPNTNQIINN